MTFAQKARVFYNNLKLTQKLPAGIHAMNPYQVPAVRSYVAKFLDKFYDDEKKRLLVLGINPGRFGGGLTGISFTDPVALQECCGIGNPLPKVRELSSVFVYRAIEAWGGPGRFFGDFFISAICPLGFTRGGKNYNYYDNPQLVKAVGPFILESLEAQMALGISRQSAVILGRGKNLKFFTHLNKKYGFFDKIYALDHPRFIMQYRRRYVKQHLRAYQQVFKQALLE